MPTLRRVAAFGAAILAGATVGLLFGLLAATDRPVVSVTPPTRDGPTAYRCGVVNQPEIRTPLTAAVNARATSDC